MFAFILACTIVQYVYNIRGLGVLWRMTLNRKGQAREARQKVERDSGKAARELEKKKKLEETQRKKRRTMTKCRGQKDVKKIN